MPGTSQNGPENSSAGIKEVQDSLRGVNRQLGEIDADLRRTDLSDIKEAETETSAEEDEQGSHE